MTLDKRLIGFCVLAALFSLSLAASAQTLNITNGIQSYTTLTNTTVTMSGQSELHLTASSNPLPGSLINLTSPDAWLLFENIQPSQVFSNDLSHVRVNGANAVADGNVRVVQYASGAVVIPQGPNFQPLELFEGPHFTGASFKPAQYTLYTGSALGPVDGSIRSFKLKRGYLVTMAENEDGTGASHCYIAQDNDLNVSILPDSLNDKIHFVRVFPWRWVTKKGAANLTSGLNLSWYYNWNIDQNSTRDLEYVPIRQNQYWPGLNQNWKSRGANTLLGYNEPDHSDQANMTVDQAIASWPDLLATGLRVGAPAVSDGGLSWLYSFIDRADAAGLRVDFVPVHYYRCYDPSNPDGAATQFYNFLKGIHDRVKRPLWVTEWNNGANWTSCADPTYAQQQAAISKMVQMLDSTPFVERYAIYNWVEDVRRVQWDDGSLTAAGVTYRDEVSPLSYVQEIPDAGTRSIAQYQFENDALDTSGYGNNGFVEGTPQYVPGHSGQGIALDGANNFIQLPPNIGHSSDFTFAAWVYWNGGGNWQRIFDFGNDTSHYLFLTPRSGNNTLRLAICNGGSEQIVETTVLPSGKWQHVAVTLHGSLASLYTNGVLAASGSVTIPPSAFNPTENYLGKSQFQADPLFSGKLDDVQIADSALTAPQIAALMTDQAPQIATRLFDGGAATLQQVYSSNLVAGSATDPDSGDVLTYSKATGPAWLTVNSNGTVTGTPGPLDGGTNYFTLRATDRAGASAFTVLRIYVPVVFADGTWSDDANGAWSDTTKWLGGVVANGPSSTADFGSLNISSSRIVTMDSPRTLGNLKFGDTSGAQNWTIASTGGSLTLDTGSTAVPSVAVNQNQATIAAAIAGTNGLAKTGSGTLILSGHNSLSGTIYVDTSSTTTAEDAVRAANPDALLNVTNIQIRDNNSGSSTLQLDGSAGDIQIAADFSVNCRNNDVATIENLSGTNTLSGFVRLDVGGNRFNIQSDAGLLEFSGPLQYAGSLTGGRNFVFTGDGNHLVSGPILAAGNGAPIGVIKNGSGALTLAGVNSYTNTTAVNGGALFVNGAINSSPIVVASSAMLGGNGLIRSPVTIQSGATLSPGGDAQSIGTLVIANALTMESASRTRMKLSAAPMTNDVLQVSSPLTFTGTLELSNISGIATAGDHFKLFSAPSYTGAFSSLIPATPGVGLVWNTNQLGVNGTLAVALGNVNPQFNSAMVWGSNLVFSGSGGAAGVDFAVLTSTNLLVPIENWDVLATGKRDRAGNFVFTNSALLDSVNHFFSVRIP